MSFRKVQSPVNPRGLIYCYLIGPEQDDRIRKALPGWAIVADATAPLAVSLDDLSKGRAVAGVRADIPVGLIAWSAGCQSIRSILQRNLIPPDRLVAVHVADGTHADVPPESEPWKIQIWADLMTRARAGEMIFTATCSSMTYTKDIPAGKPGRAWPTSYVLARALGLADTALEVEQPVIDGSLYVERFPSKDIDGPAHIAQVVVIMPAVLSAYWSHQGAPPVAIPVTTETPEEEPAPVTSPGGADPVKAWLDPATALPERLALWGESELAAHVREVPKGSNDGPRIQEYDATPTMRAGKPIKSPRTAWCAKAVAFGLFTVALGEPIPVLRVSGFEFETDSKAAKPTTWTTTPKRGDIVILQREGGADWWRHVGIVTAVVEHGFTMVAGNENDAWAERQVNESDPLLKGFVSV